MAPLFTQKHYEHFSSVIRKFPEWPVHAKKDLTDFLCEVFKADNPKFKAFLFRKQCSQKGDTQ